MIEKLLDRLLKKKVIINCEHDPYLHRWFLYKGERLGIYIHKFVRSDEDRCLHDHPWPFIVIPIWRGYYEHARRQLKSTIKNFTNEDGSTFSNKYYELGCTIDEIAKEIRYTKRRVYPIIGTRFRKGTFRHRVELVKRLVHLKCCNCEYGHYSTVELPAWSIFIRFKHFREWGFWPEGKFISWQKWWKENKCE